MMKSKTKRPSDTVVYMEVYGSNRVIYRVTAGSLVRHGVLQPTYGVALEDLRSGARQDIADFSQKPEQTIAFANDLIRRGIRPDELYDVALEYLSYQVLSSRKSFSR